MAEWGGGFNSGFTDIRHFTLKYAKVFAGESNEIVFWHLESESSMRIDGIKRTSDTGLDRIVGYKMILTLYIPNNEFADGGSPERYADLEELRASKRLTNVYVGMGSAVGDINEASGFWFPTFTNGAPLLTSDEINATVMALNCTGIIIETVERRPRTIITLEGLYSKKFFEDGFGVGFFNA